MNSKKLRAVATNDMYPLMGKLVGCTIENMKLLQYNQFYYPEQL